MQVAGIPSRCLSFTPESLVPCRRPVRKLGSAELCDGSMRYRMRSRGIRNGKSLGIPKGPDLTKRDFAMFSKWRAVPPGQFELEAWRNLKVRSASPDWGKAEEVSG